jgi:hypothetical protein
MLWDLEKGEVFSCFLLRLANAFDVEGIVVWKISNALGVEKNRSNRLRTQ